MKTLEELRKIAIKGRLYCAAIDEIGVYPRAFEGKYENRNDYMNGWNAALMKMRDNQIKIIEFFNSLPMESKNSAENLLLHDVLNFEEAAGQIHMWLNMNDTFAWASADGEDVLVEELILVNNIYEIFGEDGLTAFVAQKRGYEPIKPRLTEKYYAAVNELKKGLK